MYNAEKTIIRALKSVYLQTYLSNYQVIIVNDGSTDKSKSIVEEYIKENNLRNILIIDKLNGGVSSARNVGLKLADGEYIALLDSDDEWLPEKNEKQMAIFNKYPSVDLIGTNRNGEYFERFLFKKFSHITDISPKLLLLKCFFPTPTVIFKRSVMSTIGYFDESKKFGEDVSYWIRISQKFKCVLLNESLVITGGGKPDFGFSGLSGNLKEMQKGQYESIKDAYSLNIINSLEKFLLNIYSTLKYWRRLIIVKFRDNENTNI